MKKMLVMFLVCVLLAGCDYTVPLVEKPEVGIDAAVVGLWQRSLRDGKTESLLVLPLGKKEYLVVFPSDSKDAMFARGCLWRGPSATLVQLDWFGTARGNTPDDNRTFQYVAYAVESDSLTLRLLNPEVVSKEIDSTDALAKAIATNWNAPNLFRDEMVFEKTGD